MNEIAYWFSSLLHEKGVTLSPTQLQQFDIYYKMLVEWNERMNLTGITQEEAVYEKHFYDSISLAFYMDMPSFNSIADIGSGAGFPSIPLKICFPHLKVLIVDSLNKRTVFLKQLCDKLNLDHVEILHARAEDASRLDAHRDRYDLVTARAVARLNILNELCLPFARTHGLFAAMKGTALHEELVEARRSLRELNGKVKNQTQFKLPKEQSDRHIVMIEKVAQTPNKYPRKAGIPMKEPLM